MFRKTKSVALLVSAAAAALTLAASPAPALTQLPTAPSVKGALAWDCDPWAFCIYEHGNGTGAHLKLKSGVYNLGGISGGILNDNVYSVKNISGGNWCLYSEAGYVNKLTTIPDGKIGPPPGTHRQQGQFRTELLSSTDRRTCRGRPSGRPRTRRAVSRLDPAA
ncbi:peptidase inhibitor family I36 protein [Streptomyces cremeus]|uniref:peptidase inhibitor family I36 protein n=1 Tax=Streptomyces cremeus TaxID=66881 RepID=UPI0031F04A60